MRMQLIVDWLDFVYAVVCACVCISLSENMKSIIIIIFFSTIKVETAILHHFHFYDSDHPLKRKRMISMEEKSQQRKDSSPQKSLNFNPNKLAIVHYFSL